MLYLKQSNGSSQAFSFISLINFPKIQFISISTKSSKKSKSKLFLQSKTDRFFSYRIVNFNDCNKEEYFSISAEGVCHYVVQEEIEFTPLARWEQEYVLYSKLKKLSVFANFRRWKAFNVWHCNVRDKRIRSSRRNLEKNLFFLNQVEKIFCFCLFLSNSQVIYNHSLYDPLCSM